MASDLRIAAWCTPRTVSTALMRSFAQRSDTTCLDEPAYAFYLETTGKAHPMREEILADQRTEWPALVVEVLHGPCATPVQFQKHMAHHLVGEADPAFADRFCNVFLIRDPREMLASFVNDLEQIEPEDTGYLQQLELFRRFSARDGEPPLVLESKDLLMDPESCLREVCRRAEIPFESAMLSWPAGRHECFGVWAPHWYARVEASTGFRPWKPKTGPFPDSLRPVLATVMPAYQELHAARLRPQRA